MYMYNFDYANILINKAIKYDFTRFKADTNYA